MSAHFDLLIRGGLLVDGQALHIRSWRRSQLRRSAVCGRALLRLQHPRLPEEGWWGPGVHRQRPVPGQLREQQVLPRELPLLAREPRRAFRSAINLTVKHYGRFSSDAKVKWEAVKVLDAAWRGPPEAR